MDALELFPSMQTSAFSLSIGTSLALESLFPGRSAPYDPERKIPERVDATKFASCWVNLATLYRNVAAAISPEDMANATEQKMADVILSEISLIDDLFANEGGNRCKPVFYHSSYRDIQGFFKSDVQLRVSTTDKQKHYDNVWLGTAKLLDKVSDKIRAFSGEVKPARYERSLILTHYPYDLVGFKAFEELVLLESNTGLTKPRSRWATKYYPIPGADMTVLPFMRKLLFVFGDKVQIKPFPMKFRKELLDIAIANKWDGMTTPDRVNLGISMGIKDPYALHVLNTL